MPVEIKSYIGIDPGTSVSSYCVLVVDAQSPPNARFSIGGFGTRLPNADVADAVLGHRGRIGIEWLVSYGATVGASVFETCYWVGRFTEALTRRGRTVEMYYRRDAKSALGLKANATDAEVRHSLIELFPQIGKTGKGGLSAIGTKANPGPLLGISKDTWQALSVAYAMHCGMGGKAAW